MDETGKLRGLLAREGTILVNLSQVAHRVHRSEQKGVARGATSVDKVVDELKQYDFEIISTDMPAEQE